MDDDNKLEVLLAAHENGDITITHTEVDFENGSLDIYFTPKEPIKFINLNFKITSNVSFEEVVNGYV